MKFILLTEMDDNKNRNTCIINVDRIESVYKDENGSTINIISGGADKDAYFEVLESVPTIYNMIRESK